MHFENGRSLLRLRVIEALPLRHGNPIALGQESDCFREGQVIVFHYELEYVTPSVAAEALIDLKCTVHAERWRLLRVKRAKPDVSRSRALTLQPDIVPDHIDNVELAFELLGKSHN